MLKLLQGTTAPDTPKQRAVDRIKAMPKPPSLLQCYRCGCREVIQTKIGVTYKNGKAIGGTKSLICANCFMKGERVTLV